MNLLERLTRRRCREVAAVLQSYLDGEVDPVTAHAVSEHLEVCRRCGLDASTYRAIRLSIPAAATRSRPSAVDPEALGRLRRFASQMHRSEGTP
jgi:anti-sigma factor RsiW